LEDPTGLRDSGGDIDGRWIRRKLGPSEKKEAHRLAVRRVAAGRRLSDADPDAAASLTDESPPGQTDGAS